jgi:superfamily II DNA or RNA helicase
MSYELKQEYELNQCDNPENQYSKECNNFLLKKELAEYNYLSENTDENESLYPSLDDPNFIIKIAEKKEFNDTRYDGDIYQDIQKRADMLGNAEFELAPHQLFVKNFLSSQTPYNSLLLYHQLGTGKTCSAIGICEEMRAYLKQVGIQKRIIIVASPNVQDNFRLQLFDQRKLKLVDGLWNIRACTGNNLIKEINPMNMKNMSKEKVISQINTLINTSYLFLGYDGFANYITKVLNFNSEKPNQAQAIRNLRAEFNGRLIVIDEIHNIRISEDNENKKVALYLMKLVKSVDNLRLLMLSATPMYNTYREIIWLLNLMNANDRRGQIDIKNVFDKMGNFKPGGEELLIRKATGYISYIRGENPYTFPFRVFPNIFSPANTFMDRDYPKYQMNGKIISKENAIKILKEQIYTTNIGSYQSLVYKVVIDGLRKRKPVAINQFGESRKMPTFENMETFGYTMLQLPIESLNMVYPMDGLEEFAERVAPIERFSDGSEEEVIIEPEPVVGPEPVIMPAPVVVEEEEEVITIKVKRCPNGTRRNPKTKECEKIKPKQEKIVQEEEREPSPTLLEANEDGPFVMNAEQVNPEPIEDLDIDFANLRLEEPSQPPQLDITNRASSENSIPDAPTEELEGVDMDITAEPSSENSIASTGGGDSSPISNSMGMGDNDYINYHDLTGKKGLSRIMSFVDKSSPPEKGSYAYKTEKFGRIFSPTEIGKYSSKIKNICDIILKSEGIILVYSQYIDAGLIPFALALEELGFTRNGADSLFKDAPTSPIDSITMQPRNTAGGNFSPAKYAMITGDPRISPDNQAEVNAITNDNNKDGTKIKVILISRAGSEGVDFKFIRQVHILDPWYTMNRIEQIIGRGVRSFSHKDLPFEKRNVEIYLHGTILEDNKEEPADLYVYRVAEYKAVQMGRVARILKETAVDCLLNNDQVNFTQANMNINVRQVLSDGQVIEAFPVGDMPYSATCDYMETCEFKCKPFKNIEPDDINNDTYSESFITMNNDKLIQKVKDLMKEKFFYKKQELLSKINTPKPYPYVQIYAALTQLIEDGSEVIVDKYGRSGYLVNIDEYYLFQPSELNSTNSSVFDRSVPIDYKHNMINFELNAEIAKKESPQATTQVERELQLSADMDKKTEKDVKTNDLITLCQAEYDLALSFISQERVPRGDDNWYKHCGVVMGRLMKEYPDITLEELKGYLIDHILDLLLYEDKLQLLNYITKLQIVDETSFEYKIKSYFDRFIIKGAGLTGIIMYNKDDRKLLILNADDTWVDAEREDQKDLTNAIKEKYTINASQFNQYVGFIGYETTNKYLVFKVKDLLAKRTLGARCDQATKAKNLVLLNKIVGIDDKYTKDNIKPLTDSSVCCLQELIMRHYSSREKNGKIWFLDHTNAKLHNF